MAVTRQPHDRLVANWRVATIKTQTVDEYGVLFRNLFAMDQIWKSKSVHGIMISSVVPPLDSTLRQVCERYFNTKPLFIEPGVKTGMPVLYDNPGRGGRRPDCECGGRLCKIWRAVHRGGFRHGHHVRLCFDARANTRAA